MEPVDQPARHTSSAHPSWPIYLLVAVLAGAALISSAYLYRERQHGQELATTNLALSTTLEQLQNRLQDLTQRIDKVSAPALAIPVAQPQPAKARPAKTSKAAAQRSVPRDDPRFQELKGQLSDQQKELASTREDLNKTETISTARSVTLATNFPVPSLARMMNWSLFRSAANGTTMSSS